MKRKRSERRGGYTLAELLTVILLFSITVPTAFFINNSIMNTYRRGTEYTEELALISELRAEMTDILKYAAEPSVDDEGNVIFASGYGSASYLFTDEDGFVCIGDARGISERLPIPPGLYKSYYADRLRVGFEAGCFEVSFDTVRRDSENKITSCAFRIPALNAPKE